MIFTGELGFVSLCGVFFASGFSKHGLSEQLIVQQYDATRTQRLLVASTTAAALHERHLLENNIENIKREV